MLLVLSITTLCYAQDEEKIELTTYYPAPYGKYDELQANKLAVGSGVATSEDGVISLKNLATPPTEIEGSLYYDSGNR